MKNNSLRIKPGTPEKYTHKRKALLLAVVSIALLLLTGCNSERVTLNNTNTEGKQGIDSETIEDPGTDAMTPLEPETIEVTPSVTENSSRTTSLLFSELLKYQFEFSSGVGAWQTTLTINEDGTFQGYFSDSDMGDTGEGYPNGIVYSSTFEGKFTTPVRMNDYTYSMTIEYINLEEEAGSEEIVDGIKFIYWEPYGLEDAKEIYIYTPKAPIKELPEGFMSWVKYQVNDAEYLPFYGLYNVETENGFSSYETNN